MSEWTYHAQNILTGAWISRDLGLRDVEITDVLSGHGILTATIAPEDSGLMLVGERVLQEWQTVIYPEKAGALRGGFIFTESNFVDDGQEWEIICESFTSDALDEPYNRTYREWQVDALDVVREIWDFLQARTNGNLGLTIDADLSGQLLGDVQPPAKPVRADVTYPVGSAYGTAGAAWPRPARPKRPKRKRPKKRKRRRRESLSKWNAYLARFAARLARWQAIKLANWTNRLPEWKAWHDRLDAQQSAWETTYGDREPYRLMWWEQPDCGSELERLATETPFDWREQHTWVDGTKAAVTHLLQLGYPTIGTRKTDKVFTPGVDLVLVPTVHRGGHDFANAVVAIGAGEGRKTKRNSSSVDDDRLRRTSTLTAKDVKRVARLGRLATQERKRLSLGHGVQEVAVWDVNGNLTTYRLGDEVEIDMTDGWSQGSRFHKIVGRRYRPDEDDVIYWQLIRADQV